MKCFLAERQGYLNDISGAGHCLRRDDHVARLRAELALELPELHASIAQYEATYRENRAAHIATSAKRSRQAGEFPSCLMLTRPR